MGGQSVLFPRNVFFNEQTLPTYLLTIFPVVICFFCLKEYAELYGMLVRASYIVVVSFVIIFLLFGNTLFKDTYSMGLTNSLIIPLNTLSYKTIYEDKRKQRTIDTALIVLSLAGIIMRGSRGGIISIMCCITFLMYKKRGRTKFISRICMVVFFGVLLLPFYGMIIQGIIGLIAGVDITSSRTLWILANDPFHDSGRINMWKMVWCSFVENPFYMRGINSDYFIIGTYSHTYILELLHSFGLILGGIVLIVLFSMMLRGFSKKITDKRDAILVICMFSFFPQCFFSGSIWVSTYFWIWLAIFTSYKKGNANMKDIVTEI